MPENKIALVILAGGKSSRMGREKSDLILNGNTFLEIQIEKGKQLGIKKIYISGYKGVRCTEEIVMDRIKNRGPLGGLEACFRKASNSKFSRNKNIYNSFWKYGAKFADRRYCCGKKSSKRRIKKFS